MPSELKNRYGVWAGSQYYPQAGLSDCRGWYPTAQAARRAAQEGIDSGKWDWVDIYMIHTDGVSPTFNVVAFWHAGADWTGASDAFEEEPDEQ